MNVGKKMSDIEVDPLHCSLDIKNDVAYFKFTGSLAIYQTLDIKDTVNKLIEKNIGSAVKKIIFNLSELEYLDSYGVSFIIDFHSKFEHIEKNLFIYYGSNKKLQKLFKTIRIGLIIPVLDKLDAIP
jgi:anti-anti-sigma factor